MQLYSCRVRLKGSLLNTVNKEDVTASEIRLLDHIHAGDNPAVFDITPTKADRRTDRDERERLSHLYGEFMGISGPQMVAMVLGVPGVPLPQTIEEGDERLTADNGIAKAREAVTVPGPEKPKVRRTAIDPPSAEVTA